MDDLVPGQYQRPAWNQNGRTGAEFKDGAASHAGPIAVQQAWLGPSACQHFNYRPDKSETYQKSVGEKFDFWPVGALWTQMR